MSFDVFQPLTINVIGQSQELFNKTHSEDALNLQIVEANNYLPEGTVVFAIADGIGLSGFDNYHEASLHLDAWKQKERRVASFAKFVVDQVMRAILQDKMSPTMAIIHTGIQVANTVEHNNFINPPGCAVLAGIVLPGDENGNRRVILSWLGDVQALRISLGEPDFVNPTLYKDKTIQFEHYRGYTQLVTLPHRYSELLRQQNKDPSFVDNPNLLSALTRCLPAQLSFYYQTFCRHNDIDDPSMRLSTFYTQAPPSTQSFILKANQMLIVGSDGVDWHSLMHYIAQQNNMVLMPDFLGIAQTLNDLYSLNTYPQLWFRRVMVTYLTGQRATPPDDTTNIIFPPLVTSLH